MANSPELRIFSARIVSIDYYMAPPIPGIDMCYSSFQGGKVNEVPVIRVYGSTPAGQKTCLHVHKAFPYLYIPCSDMPPNLQKEGDTYTNAISLALEKALKLKGNAVSKRQHVHGCSLVRAKKFYGYHSSEELFVKVYLYYPHDVSRAADLLLGGAVLDKCMQPHESHIPFILQFLVDYNLYGMGHVHLSKMNFRNPVPRVFTSKKCCYDIEHGVEMDKSTCGSADFQADLSGGEFLNSPVWVSSTIPRDWMWQSSCEFDASSDQGIHPIKRQSVCELEGDSTVDDVLNQQFKAYTSLSQAHSDVKMVQSLIPIWEEENERTGLRETAIPPDPGKLLPEDVLKTLSHGLELERKLSELCTYSEYNSSLVDKNETLLQPVASSIEGESLSRVGNANGRNINLEALEFSAERDVVEALSLQGSGNDVTDVTPPEMKDASPKLLSVNELQPSENSGSFDKAADTEALGLLRWLATSQAADDINSDDELVREIILSPLLPATTINKVLEKANTDYENESQKECQDILDSIGDLFDFEGLKEKASYSIDGSHYPLTSPEKKIRKVDNLDSSSPCSAGNSSKMEIKGESRRPMFWTTGGSLTNKHRGRKSLWGPLPLSTTRNFNNDLKDVRSDSADVCTSEIKHCEGKAVAGDEEGKFSDALVMNINVDACEESALVGCSLRDLMRRKRHGQVAQLDSRCVGAKKVSLEREQKEDNILFPQKLYLHKIHSDDHGRRQHESLSFRPSVTTKHLESLESNASKPIHSSSLSFACSSGSPFQVSICPTSVYSGKKELQCPCNPTKQDYVVSLDHCKTNNGKELVDRGLISTIAVSSNVNNSKSNLLSDNQFEGTLADKRLEPMDAVVSNCLSASSTDCRMFATHCYEEKYTQEGQNSMEQLCLPNENLLAMNVSLDNTILQSDNHSAAAQGGDTGLSALGSSVSVPVNMGAKPVGLIGMTFCSKPPIADGKDETFSHALSHYPSFVKEEGQDGILGSSLDELLPFFEVDCKERKEVVHNKSLENSDNNVRQEATIGVPTHYQNDGSLLYLLTPVFSPPSVQCVNRWLLRDNEGNPAESNAVSSELLPVKGAISHLLPIMDQTQEEINQNISEEAYPCHENVQRPLQNEGNIAKLNSCTDNPIDMSQISGPRGDSLPTPLSQIGFRDPSTVGAGQQLTLLSIEVQAESRGDLRPDPRFDAINVVALAFKNDNDSSVEVYVLLRSSAEAQQRSSDGISGIKMLIFSEEKHLFSHFIRVIGSFDPDILMGWDIQGGSLTFLAERAAYLGIGLLNSISRTPLETHTTVGGTEISDKGIIDGMLHDSVVSESVVIEDAVIQDEWGRTHASGVHVGGRIVLNVWRLMRGEIKLNIYTVEAVGEAVLRRKIPSIPCKVLTKWFSSGPGRARYRCIEYVIQRAKLNFEIMDQLDMINRTSELARVYGIDFFSVLSRGSQYRVESMFLRLAHSQNYLAISPGNQQVASQSAMECLPLVMEPESRFYADPVVVLDFQSLYPSMIIAYNLCFCTCLGNVALSKANTLGVSSYLPEPCALRDLKDKILLTPNGVMYASSKVRKGVLPRLLEEILSTRIMVKKAMKKLCPSQKVLHRIFDARQLALKLIANVTYGYTAAGFSGRMPCAELADSIVQCGRSTLEKAIYLVNASEKWRAKVVYGDTDSMFVLLKDRSVKEAFQIGQEIASAVTAMNPDPVLLKLEKVYHPCFLLTKKRYVGYSYESPDQIEPIFDAKGIETVRRDTCAAVAKIMEQSLRLFFEHQDIYKVKEYLQRQWTRILSGRVSLQDFVFAKEVRLGTYSARASSSLPPAAIVATKAMKADPRAEPRYAERVPYVVIHGEPGARLVDMVVDPMDLLAIDSPYRLNDIYYINKQIIPALQRAFGLVGADLNQWFIEMPRPAREAFTKCPLYAPNPLRKRIDYYYLSRHCLLCGELVNASAHICNKCLQKQTATATAVIGRTAKLEKDMQHLVAICRHCGGGDWLLENGVKCTSLACSVFFQRRKVQKELQGLAAVAADIGFYPKCNVEWF